MTSSDTAPDPSDDEHGGEPAIPADEPPAVLSPGDSDAPDAPDPGTVYPDEQGVPGEPGR